MLLFPDFTGHPGKTNRTKTDGNHRTFSSDRAFLEGRFGEVGRGLLRAPLQLAATSQSETSPVSCATSGPIIPGHDGAANFVVGEPHEASNQDTLNSTGEAPYAVDLHRVVTERAPLECGLAYRLA